MQRASKLRRKERVMTRLIADLDCAEPIRLAAALQAGKKVAPDVTGLLADDHRTVLGWFGWYEQTPDRSVRTQLARRICTALKAHMAGEEEFFYPALRRVEAGAPSAERALAEHAKAKSIMAKLERAPGGAAKTDGLIAQLKDEIAAHVVEEETELFPLARRAPIDLYDLGRKVAARRVAALLELRTGGRSKSNVTKQEIPMPSISEADAREYFLLGLKNAHATIRQGRVLVAGQLERVENYPQLKAKLASHLGEKDSQLARLEKLLETFGESPSAVKDAAMAAAAGVAGVASAAAADEIVKNGFATLAQAKYEAAALETLIVFAQAAGELAALRPLQQCLSESRGLASFVEESLRGTAVRFLQLRAEGRQAKR
jgi:ferritin-like metal-binding protein YciE